MTATVVVAVLCFLAPIVHLMPQATLAVIVVVPCMGMIKISEFRALGQFRLMEFSWAAAAGVGVVLLGTLQGILVAVGFLLLGLIFYGSRPPGVCFGRKKGARFFSPRFPEKPKGEVFSCFFIL